MARELREFLDLLQERYPDQMVRVHKEVDPAHFDVTAILQHLENRDRYPLVLFEQPRNLRAHRRIVTGALEVAAALGRFVLERSRVEFPDQPGIGIGHQGVASI